MKREITKSAAGRPHVFIEYDKSNPVDLIRLVSRERYAWPGGYELAAVTDDGGLLCSTCVRAEYRQIIHDTKHDWRNTGWRVVAVTNESELEDVCCSHCGKALGYQTEVEQ
jgi:hypothetical protein